MDTTLAVQGATTVQSGLILAVQLSLPVIGAAVAGAFIAGFIRIATQIDDVVVSYAIKFAAVVLLLYLSAGYIYSDVVTYTERVWGGSDAYH